MKVAVRGAGLAGLAAAARLAYLGHDVYVHSHGQPLGGRWASYTGPGGLVDDMPPIVTLPAAWRDLFTKSGAPLVRQLNGAGLSLVEAPPPEHRFPDGSSLVLPTNRGAQRRAITHVCGEDAAERWEQLLDELDQVWISHRRFGVETPAMPANHPQRRSLWLERTLADVADRLPDARLSQLVLSLGPSAGTRSAHAPGLLAVQLSVERTFGRWQLVDQSGTGQRASHLIDLLRERLTQRGVVCTDASNQALEHPAACLDARPQRAWFDARRRAALAPRVSHRLISGTHAGISTVIEHAASPVVVYERPQGDATLQTTFDYRRARRRLDSGWEPASAQAWLARQPVAGDPLRAWAGSPAGNTPWGELASAALASYAVHERLTGEDCRPANRQWRRMARG